MFRQACKYGFLQILIRIWNLKKITREDVCAQNNFALRSASEYGHLKVLIFLKHLGCLTPEDFQSFENYAFCWACFNKHFLQLGNGCWQMLW